MYGLWALLASVVGYYGLLDLGLSTAITRHVAGAIGRKDEETCNHIFNTALIVYAGLGIIALLISVGLAVAAPAFIKQPSDIYIFRAVILILGVNVAIGLPERVLGGVLASELCFTLESSLQLLALLLRSILVVAALLAGYGVVALALATVLSAMPVRVLHAYYTHKRLPFLHLGLRYFKKATLKQLFSFSSFIFIGQIANHLRFHVDYLVISIFLSLVAVTHYKIAALLVYQYNVVMFALTGVLHPLFSRLEGGKDRAGIQKIFLFGTKLTMIPASFIGYGFLVWGRPFIEVWMGPDYLDAYPCLVVLTISTIIMLWQNVSANLFIGMSRHKLVAFLNSVEGVSNLTLSLILVRRYGIIGVALGTAIPMFITKLIIQPIYASKTAGVPYRSYMLGMARTASLIALILVVPGWLSITYAKPTYSSLIFFGVISLIIYSVGVWFIIFKPTEKQLIFNLIRPLIGRYLPVLNCVIPRHDAVAAQKLNEPLVQDE